MQSPGVNSPGAEGPREWRVMSPISGPSSMTFQTIGAGALLLLILAGATGGIGLALNQSGDPLFFFSLYVFFAALGVLLAAVGGYQVQYRRELSQGYTSATTNFANAAQIDARSGVVIREPGDPFLDRTSRKARTASARRWARERA